MFEFIGMTFFSFIDKYVNETSASLSAYLSVVLVVALTLYFIMMGYAVMRGAVQDSINTVVWNSTKMAIILFIACGAGVYQTEVIGTVHSISSDLVNAVTINGGNCDQGHDSIMMLRSLDCNASQGLTVLEKLFNLAKSKFTVFGGNYVDGVTLFLCAIIYVIAYVILIASIGLGFFTNLLTLNLVLALGPVFIAALAFEPSKRYGEGWINKVVYCLVFQLLITIYTGLCFTVFYNVLTYDFDNPSALAVLKWIVSIVITLIMLAYMSAKLDNIANSIVGAGDNTSGLFSAAGGLVLQRLMRRRNPGKNDAPHQGGTIHNSQRGFKHAAHRIAERFRNK